MRLTGPLHGVRFLAPGDKSVNGILDCRLVVALDDFAVILARHDVQQVQVDNYFRPNAHLAGRRKFSQHAYGLAIDLTAVTLGDGRVLDVERDWHGSVGDPPCGPDAHPQEPTEETLLLRNLLCDVARSGIFHFMLTPGFDAAHHNHFHFDVQWKSPGMSVR